MSEEDIVEMDHSIPNPAELWTEAVTAAIQAGKNGEEATRTANIVVNEYIKMFSEEEQIEEEPTNSTNKPH